MKKWVEGILFLAVLLGGLTVACWPQEKPTPPEFSSTEKMALITIQAEASKVQSDIKDFGADFAKVHPGWTWTPEKGIQAAPKPPDPKAVQDTTPAKPKP
jgi:hypothetical protein